MTMMKTTAIVLAAGSGKRMNSKVHKQYLMLSGKPVLYYALKAFEESNITDIVLVTGHGETEYCRRELVEKYAFTKVTAIVDGGKERYHSVYEGLKAAKGTDYVLIHDGARPFVDEKLIARLIDTVKECQACVAAVPVKDTIKIADGDGFVKETPDRSLLWQIQTPQAFFYPLILDAYEKMFARGEVSVTDDSMVLEQMTEHKVKLVQGSYQNLKITTPEDLVAAEAYLSSL